MGASWPGWGLRPAVVTADAGYGSSASFRAGLEKRTLAYVLQVKGDLTAYAADYEQGGGPASKFEIIRSCRITRQDRTSQPASGSGRIAATKTTAPWPRCGWVVPNRTGSTPVRLWKGSRQRPRSPKPLPNWKSRPRTRSW
ncbi:transposase [Streptomyces violascens]|uniref:transposase n=1 Tax=Streptomyces violascens TaxID=67381 RepID=UPI00365C9FEB